MPVPYGLPVLVFVPIEQTGRAGCKPAGAKREAKLPFIQAGHIQLYFETEGEGQRLLFIPGSNGDLRMKPNMFNGPLKDHFELVSYDQRGLGQSDKPEYAYSMADYANDAINLMDAGGWETCNVLGYSFGGMVAQELAINYPDRVEKLVLCASSPGGEGGTSFPLHELEEMPVKLRIPLSISTHDTRKNDAWQAENPDFVVAAAREMNRARLEYGHEPGWEKGREQQLEARRHHNTWDRLHQISAPTLICGGKYDGSAKPDYQHKMAGRIPNAEVALFEGGHLFIAQDKAANARIIDFLKEG